MRFSDKILAWYRHNRRDLPWRETRDPYKVWLSEIILQQTRVAQGLPYYHKFLQNYPTVEKLAEANEQEILKLWQGLGYYSRARNLHATAQMVCSQYGGKFPDTYKELLKLKGVGDYTASAIASFCFGLPEPVLDGNVFRVLARYYGVDMPIDSGKAKKYFRELARQSMDPENIRDYNQAIMEFGAVQCVPVNPNCSVCKLNDSCRALQQGLVGQLPVKANKTAVRKRYFNYLVLIDPEGRTLLQKRESKGIWQSLYEFPLVETENLVPHGELISLLEEPIAAYTTSGLELSNEEPVVHKLSHQHLYTRFWMAYSPERIEGGIALADLESFPVPVLIADYIRTLKNSYF